MSRKNAFERESFWSSLSSSSGNSIQLKIYILLQPSVVISLISSLNRKRVFIVRGEAGSSTHRTAIEGLNISNNYNMRKRG